MVPDEKKSHLEKYRSERVIIITTQKLREAVTGLGDTKLLDLMLGHGFDINSTSFSSSGNTPLHLVITEGTQ